VSEVETSLWTETPVLLPRAGAPADARIRALRGELRIGRDRQCDVVLLEPTISRHHARLTFDGARLTVIDTGSSVGTFVNGERIGEQDLRLGDRVRFGQAEFEVGVETSGTHPLEVAFLRSRPEESVRYLQTLLEVSRSLAAANELDQVLAIVLESAARLLEGDRARVVLLGVGGDPDAFASYPPGLPTEADEERSALLKRAIETKSTRVWGQGDQRSESMEGRGVLEAAACPMLVVRRPLAGDSEASFIGRVEVLGGILLERTKGMRGFDRSQLSVLESLAADAAAAIDGARLYRESREKTKIETEMELARTLQSALLVPPPQVPFADSFASYDPASRVGGDLYHGALRADGTLAAALGDVSGKGVGAALWMALAQGLLGLLHDLAHPIENLLPELNRALRRHNPNNRFLTFAFLQLAADGAARFASAGHCPAVLLRAGRPPEELPPTGAVLGLLPSLRWEVRTLQLEPGDTVVLYSDGVSESTNRDDKEFGVEGVVAALGALAQTASTAEAIGKGLLEAARRFRAGAEAADDVTVVAVRYLG
jgi:serine phosphatase RsbU (regulator of sigma subunit)/pSer/pThr/pTyr-binding forkhead associated (FHA) protein